MTQHADGLKQLSARQKRCKQHDTPAEPTGATALDAGGTAGGVGLGGRRSETDNAEREELKQPTEVGQNPN